jgi:ubiquinone biosynthesis protein Coq4
VTATIDRTFAESLLRTFDDPKDLPVHLLFNQFWQHAPQEVVGAYHRHLVEGPLAGLVAEAHFPEPLTVERLAECPPGSYGRAVQAFVVENGLQASLATDYKAFHEALAASGMLDGMPEDMRYAVLRGFQLHDLLHVVTGYGPSPRDELALQAFCLAQLQFPYFAMWVSVVTTRMTFIDPATIVGVMDAITEGWRFGRTVANLQLLRWEDHIDEPIEEVRAAHGIGREGRAAAA